MKFAIGELLCSLFLIGGVAYAQGTGTIHGTVTDPSELPIAGAKVTATLGERGMTRTVETDSQGAYVLPSLPIGTYAIRVEVQGFKLFNQSGVGLTANQNARVNARLDIGSVSESVSVSTAAPLIDSRSSVVGTLIDSRRVLELPINGRNIIALAGLLPGASQVSSPQTFTNERQGPTASVSGSRGNQNLFLFDGAQFTAIYRNTGLNYPPPDALAEVKVLTNSFSAEYGRNAGSVFNVVTKSGANQIHGSAWEFLRNQKLNARNFFAPSQKPQLIQNQFGATAGGPIRKDRLFVFGSYEGLRIRPASLSTAAFPLTVAERDGDFSATKAAVRDPLTGQGFPNNQIPSSRIDPVARNVLSRNLMPLPNRPDGQWVTTYPTPQNNNSFLVRVDYNLGKHTLDGHYNINLAKDRGFEGHVPAYFPLSNSSKSQSITAGDTLVLKPNLLNQARLSFNRNRSSGENLSGFNLSDLGGNFPQFGGPKIPPNLVISGRVTLGTSNSRDVLYLNQTLQFSDSVTWTRSSHTMKLGFELLRLRYYMRAWGRTEGDFSFTGGITGNAAADYMLGRAANLVVSGPGMEVPGLQTNTSYFIQDDWRLNARFTLNLGLRYELSPPWSYHNEGVTLRPGQQSQVIKSAPLGLVFPGDPGIPPGLVQTDKNNFAPRVGFAWSPFGDGRTSVRGAYGIFYESVNPDVIQWYDTQPFRYTFTIGAPYSLADPLRGQPAIPVTINLKDPVFVGKQQIFDLDTSLRSPYVQQFNLNVQRQVVKDLSVQVAYVGKLGRKLMMGLSTNPAVYGPGATLANLDQRRILQPFGNNSKSSSQANSSYSAMQMEVNKRFSKGFSLQGAYTFSRSIDTASAISLGPGAPNVFDLRTQRGLSDFHAKHIGSLSWIWDLPRLTSRDAVLRAIAGGWQVNGIVSGRSGMPVNILVGSDVALSGTSNQRPDAVGNPGLSADRPRAQKILAWFDRGAFARAAAGAYGNAGRNAVIGAPAATTNMGLFKTFDVPGREGLRLQFRSEFFNLFNSVNLGNPNTNLTSGANMGRITSAAEARVIQFALKALF